MSADERAAGAADGRLLSNETLRWIQQRYSDNSYIAALFDHLDAQAEQLAVATEAAAQATLAMVESGRAALALQAELARVEAERALTWSTEVPTTPGWYFWRLNEGREERVYRIYRNAESLQMAGPSFVSPLSAFHDGEWAGPLPRPAEPAPDPLEIQP